jgi:phytanoyl-CoA hydroxylase
MLLQRYHLADQSGILRSFDENGFAIISDIFSEELINDFKIELSQIIKAYLLKAGASDNYNAHNIFHEAMRDLEDLSHVWIASIYDTIFQCPSFLKIISEKKFTNIIRLLLGGENTPLYGYTNRCRIDPPMDNRRTYGWHQEVFYTVPMGRYIQAWAPLVANASVDNGTIQVAIGSHKKGILKQNWMDFEGRATQILVDPAEIKDCPKEFVEMKVGELLLFSGYLAHQSGDNISKDYRYSLVGMYHDVNTKEFIAPSIDFKFKGKTPRQFYDEIGSQHHWFER